MKGRIINYKFKFEGRDLYKILTSIKEWRWLIPIGDLQLPIEFPISGSAPISFKEFPRHRNFGTATAVDPHNSPFSPSIEPQQRGSEGSSHPGYARRVQPFVSAEVFGISFVLQVFALIRVWAAESVIYIYIYWFLLLQDWIYKPSFVQIPF